MRSSVIKLETFAPVGQQPSPPPMFDQHALTQAHADGLAEGQARATQQQITALISALHQMSQSLCDDATRRHQLRDQAVHSLHPILTQIVDALADSGPSRRLEAALTREMMRLAHQSGPPVCRIECGGRHLAMVQSCLKQMPVPQITLIETPQDEIRIVMDDGHVTLNQTRMAADIRALIAEISEDCTQWTQ